MSSVCNIIRNKKKPFISKVFFNQSQIYFQSLIALLSGGALTLSFAPFNEYYFAFISLCILLSLYHHNTLKTSLYYAFLFGLGFFGCSVSWVFISIHTFGGTNSFLAAWLTALFISVLALFIVLNSLLFHLPNLLQKLVLKKKEPNKIDGNILATQQIYHVQTKEYIYIILTFPSSWFITELLRSWLFTGFPWVLLGYSQINTPLKNLAPIISVYGISFICALIATLIYFVCTTRTNWKVKLTSLIIIGMIFSLSKLLERVSWTKPLKSTISVSLIQGNIKQSIKWNPLYLDHIINQYQQWVANQRPNQLIILPEGAFPVPTFYIAQRLSRWQKQLAAQKNTLLLGTIVQKKQLYNAIVMLGEENSFYFKRHLVPFGEYLPLGSILRGVINFFDIPMSDLSPGNQDTLFQIHGYTISPSICYEIAYINLILPSAGKANILVNISDDSWFGHSIAAKQQLQMTQMRAIETGKPIIVVNNNGMSSIIEPNGQISAQLLNYRAAILHAKVMGYQGATPIVKLISLQKHLSIYPNSLKMRNL